MKASEVLRRYKAGQRDFKRVNLRGQSFKGQDLSGADFSEADIRSANFTDANLRKANFTGAKCGLQKRWAALLVILSWLLAGIVVAVLMAVKVAAVKVLEAAVAAGLGLVVVVGIVVGIVVGGVVALALEPVTGEGRVLRDTDEASIVGMVIGFPLGVVIIAVVGVATVVGVETAAVGIIGVGILAVVVTTVEVVVAIAIGTVEAAVAAVAAVEVAVAIAAIAAGTQTEAIAGAIAGAVTGIIAVAGAVVLPIVLLMVLALVVLGEYEGDRVAVAAVAVAVVVAVVVVVGLRTVAVAVAALIGVASVIGVAVAEFKHPFVIALAATGGTTFYGADLTEANFTEAKLKSTDLREANLTRVRWYGAKMLDRVRPGDTYLKNGDVLHWLIGREGVSSYFSGKIVRGINLQGLNLANTSFIGADLSESNLQNANLSRAKLMEAQLDGTDLTGACIEGWNINSETNLENVICDYIYLKEGQQERRPASGNFEPGEFAKLVETSIETVDLIFREGIDWKAFLPSFQDLRVEYGEQNVSIQAIEKKSDGAFVIRLNVPSDVDKAEIESKVKQSYETELKVLETEKRSLLRENANLNNIVYTLANRPIMNVDQSGSNIGIGHMSGGEIKGNAKVAGKMNVYASEQKQTLAEAADEIQKLLQQLEQTNPTATEAEKIAYVNDETSPGFKRRAASALKAGGETAIEEFLDNPYVNVGKAVVKGWMKPE